MQNYIKGLKKDYFVVLGDFNEGNLSLDDEIIIDVAEKLNKSNILTFSTELDRIDYMFVSNNIEVKSYEVLIKNMSDHYPIVAKEKQQMMEVLYLCTYLTEKHITL